jgi:hypothetical protein
LVYRGVGVHLMVAGTPAAMAGTWAALVRLRTGEEKVCV